MTKKKLGNVQGVSEWRDLNTVGDTKRFIKWTIHSMRDGSLTARDASIFGQLATYLLKMIEVSDLEQRLDQIEQAAGMRQRSEPERSLH